jgi:SAM-dependent methyltransferase
MSFEELKQTQSFVWGNAPFERVQESLLDVHQRVVDRLEPLGGVRFLDVACGTGQLAELAAAAGANVIGVDFSPVLIGTAKELAAAKGLEIDFRVGDAERLEFEDASFDVVSSTFGHMFAPDHQAVARELARVVRPSGRLGLATWTPDGGVGKFFTAMAQFQPPLPEGAGSPLEWGREEYVRDLLGDAFELHVEEHVTTHDAESVDEYWELFSTSFGPIKTMLERMPERADEIRSAYGDFLREYVDADGRVSHRREYLLVLGTRR